VREPDPETVRRAQAGDLGAFESLVRDCQASAWRLAYHLTGNRATADDVTQEAFVRAFRSLASFRGQWKFTSWLLRIVHNCAMDAHRRGRREERLLARTAEPPTAVSVSALADERLRIGQAVAALPRELREPFVVIEVLGHSYQEASAILGVKTGTLKSRMHRARAALVRELTEHEETADEM
jgi:RNA polymerase sigma-70 factor (ECF subfamily)